MTFHLADPLHDHERAFAAWLVGASSNYAHRQSLSQSSVARGLFKVGLMSAAVMAYRDAPPGRERERVAAVTQDALHEMMDEIVADARIVVEAERAHRKGQK